MLRRSLILSGILSCSLYIYGQQITAKDSLIMEGIEYHDEGKYQKAIELYKKALELDPSSPEAIYELSLSLLEIKDYYGAIEYSDKLLDRNDKFSPLAYNTKGSSLNYLGKTEEAIAVFEEAVGMYTDFYLLYYNIGLAYHTSREYLKAQDAFISSIRLNPRHAGSHLNLGRTMGQLNKRVESLLCLYYFLLMEQNSERSVWAYESVQEQLSDKKARENYLNQSDAEFIAIDTLVASLAEIDSVLVDDQKKMDRFINQTRAFFTAAGKAKENNNSGTEFWRSFYIPYFKSMLSWGNVDTYCHYISIHFNDISHEWLNKHPSRVRDFDSWLERQ